MPMLFVYTSEPNEADDYMSDDAVLSEIEKDEFAEYMWMENEEEFDRKELQRLQEEFMIAEGMEAMMQDEVEDSISILLDIETSQVNAALDAIPKSVNDVKNSQLNPLAEVFIPMNHLIEHMNSVQKPSTLKNPHQ